MQKIKKIILILSLIIFIILIYLLLTSDNKNKNFIESSNNISTSTAKDVVDLVELKKNYEISMSNYYGNFIEIINNDNPEQANLSKLKLDTLSLKVPAEYKDLHINFILAITKMEDYINEKKLENKEESLRIINELKNKYPAIYNK